MADFDEALDVLGILPEVTQALPADAAQGEGGVGSRWAHRLWERSAQAVAAP